MQCEDKVETEHSLAKVHKVCRLIGIIVKIIFVVFCVCWLSTVLLMIYSLINPSELGAAEGVSVPRIALYFVHGFAVALIFVVFIGIFVDAVKGQSLSYLCHCRCCHFWAYWISPICRIKFWIRVYRRQ